LEIMTEPYMRMCAIAASMQQRSIPNVETEEKEIADIE